MEVGRFLVSSSKQSHIGLWNEAKDTRVPLVLRTRQQRHQGEPPQAICRGQWFFYNQNAVPPINDLRPKHPETIQKHRSSHMDG